MRYNQYHQIEQDTDGSARTIVNIHESLLKNRATTKATTTISLTDLGSVAAGDVIQGSFDRIRRVLQHTTGDGGLTHVDYEEIHGRLGRAHLCFEREMRKDYICQRNGVYFRALEEL